MFEVYYKDQKKYMVYSVRDNGEHISPDFLIFINAHWVWVSCISCKPVNDKDYTEYTMLTPEEERVILKHCGLSTEG